MSFEEKRLNAELKSKEELIKRLSEELKSHKSILYYAMQVIYEMAKINWEIKQDEKRTTEACQEGSHI